MRSPEPFNHFCPTPTCLQMAGQPQLEDLWPVSLAKPHCNISVTALQQEPQPALLHTDRDTTMGPGPELAGRGTDAGAWTSRTGPGGCSVSTPTTSLRAPPPCSVVMPSPASDHTCPCTCPWAIQRLSCCHLMDKSSGSRGSLPGDPSGQQQGGTSGSARKQEREDTSSCCVWQRGVPWPGPQQGSLGPSTHEPCPLTRHGPSSAGADDTRPPEAD